VLRVPYGGYNGDYQEIPVLTPTPFGFPWLAKVVGANLVNQPAGASFTLLDLDVPFILVHRDHQPRRLRIEVFDTTTGQSLGFADDEAFLRGTAPPRHSLPSCGTEPSLIRPLAGRATCPTEPIVSRFQC
jgi:minor extracellular serine protease Vpr